MTKQGSFLLMLCLASMVSTDASHPMITAPAVIPRDEGEDDDLVGWYSTTGMNASERAFCPLNSIGFTDNGIFDCCATKDVSANICDVKIITACGQDEFHAVDGSGVSSMCEDGYSCNTDYIYTSNTPDASPLLWFGCANVSQVQYFQGAPVSTTSVTSSSDSLSPPTRTVAKIQSTAAPPGSATSLPTSTTIKSRKKSKGWIAGPVLGVLVVLSITALAFIILRRRRQKTTYPKVTHQTAYHQTPSGPQFFPPQLQPPNCNSYGSPPNMHAPSSSQPLHLSPHTSHCSQDYTGQCPPLSLVGAVSQDGGSTNTEEGKRQTWNSNGTLPSHIAMSLLGGAPSNLSDGYKAPSELPAYIDPVELPELVERSR